MNTLPFDSIAKKKRYSILPNVQGVYFLFLGKQLVYVGQSKNIHRRVTDHIADKEFDSYTFIEVSGNKERKELESHYIKAFNPPLNIVQPKKHQKPIPPSDSRKLINALYETQRENKLKKGFVYFKYLEKAKYYCMDDLRYIAELLGYKKNWINYKKEELKKTNKWK